MNELENILHDLADSLESLDTEPDTGKWAENGIEYIDEAERQIQAWAIATLKEVLGEEETKPVDAHTGRWWQMKARNQFRQTILKDFTERIKG